MFHGSRQRREPLCKPNNYFVFFKTFEPKSEELVLVKPVKTPVVAFNNNHSKFFWCFFVPCRPFGCLLLGFFPLFIALLAHLSYVQDEL